MKYYLITKRNLAITVLLCFFGLSFSQKNNIQLVPVLKPVNAADSQMLAKNCLERRQLLSSKFKNGIFVMLNHEKTRDNFFYITGWRTEPACAMIDLSDSSPFKLFIPSSNPHSIIWNGQQPGKAEAEKMGATSVQFFDFKKQLREIIKSGKIIYGLSSDITLKDNLKSITKSDSLKIVYIDSTIKEMRVVKSPQEIENIRKAIHVTANAINNVIRNTQPNMYEYEIAALYSFEYKRNNCEEAFPSICGSGINTTALHYETNNKMMQSGEVLLMDVGAKYNGYCADITRTIPVSGKFTNPQLEIYNLVLKAQLEGIKCMKPGNRYMDFHNKCSEIVIRGLYDLGLVTDTTKKWQKEMFVLYTAGHYLGLDVHDVGKFVDFSQKNSKGRDLIPGMVITIEPGIYINPAMLKYIYVMFENVPREELDAYVTKVTPAFQKYANIGIRIEDDILITSDGNEVLSAQVPKQPMDIERLMKKN